MPRIPSLLKQTGVYLPPDDVRSPDITTRPILRETPPAKNVIPEAPPRILRDGLQIRGKASAVFSLIISAMQVGAASAGQAEHVALESIFATPMAPRAHVPTKGPQVESHAIPAYGEPIVRDREIPVPTAPPPAPRGAANITITATDAQLSKDTFREKIRRLLHYGRSF